MNIYPESELILNADGSVYHLNLLPEDIADTIITVGDPDRVSEVSKYFDSIEVKKGKREFVAHTGMLGKKRLTVLSTGIGTDNIDIVLNELDALANIDLQSRKDKAEKKSLEIIRVGTSGTIQKDIEIDSYVVSEYAIGMDGLLHFYPTKLDAETQNLENTFDTFLTENAIRFFAPYASKGAVSLIEKFTGFAQKGITLTHTGFYAPQGRLLRGGLKNEQYISTLGAFSWNEKRITNFEMETAGIYGLGAILGHKCCSVNAIVANRPLGKFSTQIPQIVAKAIESVLEKLA